MSYAQGFYLVRHGSYNDDDDALNTVGRESHAPQAKNQLIARGVGAGCILLSSDARRAAETAQIIGEGLGVEPVLSPVINEAGNHAWSVKDLDAVVEQALSEAGVVLDGTSQDLVVVTHAPMLAIARGVASKDIGYGEVLAYTRNSWNNPGAPK